MNRDRSRTATLILIGVAGAAVAIPLVVLLIQQFTQLGVRGMPCCDHAVLELDTRAFWRGEQWVGQYSREQWYHPGPAPFMWSGLFSWLPGRNFAEYQVAAVVLATLGVAVSALAVARRVGAYELPVAFAVLAVWMARSDLAHWADPWTPWLAASWLVVCIVSAAAHGAGGSRWWLIGFIVGASMAVQTHVGTSPAVVVAAAVVGFDLWRTRSAPSQGPRWWVVASVTAALWLLPVYDLFFGGHWLARTAKDLILGDDAVEMPARPVVKALVHLVGLGPSGQTMQFGLGADATLPMQSIGVGAVLMALVGLSMATYAVVTRARHPFSFRLVVIAAGGLLVTGLAVASANGPYYRYLFLPSVGLGLMLWIGGATAVAADVRVASARWGNVLRGGATLAALGAMIVALPSPRPAIASTYSDPSLSAIIAEVASVCDELPDTAVVLPRGPWYWDVAVVAEMEHCTTVEVIGWIGFIVGPAYHAADDATTNVFIGMSAEAPPGDDLIEVDGYVVRLIGA